MGRKMQTLLDYIKANPSMRASTIAKNRGCSVTRVLSTKAALKALEKETE